MGTRLKSQGAASLVKALATTVRQSGGIVVYVDWYNLPPSSWAKYIDLHIQMDLEEWAKGYLNALDSVSKCHNSRSWYRSLAKGVYSYRLQRGGPNPGLPLR
jgi:hypothetical protein